MRRNWIWAIAAFVIAAAGVTFVFSKKQNASENTSIEKAASSSYWTCPMHPQIHSDKAGECPICHMKLVELKVGKSETSRSDARATIDVSASQLELLGVQKQQVEKMDLIAKIPVSGHFISAATVAFQIYESDLKYVKTGLPFSGESSFYPDTKIDGVVSSVDSIVDPTSRTIRVLGNIRNGPKGLISEVTFRGDVEVRLKDRVSIPESAVLHTGNGDLVYLFNSENRLVPTAVKLGLKTESFYEVLSGLAPGDFISSGPNFLIDSEAKIRGTSDQTNH